MTRHHGQVSYKRAFNWVNDFRGLESLIAEQRQGSRNGWELTLWSISKSQRELTGNGVGFWKPKVIYLLTRPHSNIWAREAPNHHASIPRSVSLAPGVLMLWLHTWTTSSTPNFYPDNSHLFSNLRFHADPSQQLDLPCSNTYQVWHGLILVWTPGAQGPCVVVTTLVPGTVPGSLEVCNKPVNCGCKCKSSLWPYKKRLSSSCQVCCNLREHLELIENENRLDWSGASVSEVLALQAQGPASHPWESR